MATTEDFVTGDNSCSGLLDAVYDFTGRFVAYPSEAAHVAHVLWIAHAHMMDAWESTPRLAFLSPEPASGKTRALEITELLVPNAVEAINVTPAYLFRKVGDDATKPTILYDEIDTVFGPKAKENEEIRGLLNAGHRRGAVAGRCVVRGKNVTTEEISAYCAVALAGLGWLPDTILTRAVIIRMRRRAPNEKVIPFRRRVHAPDGEELRRQLAAWASKAVDAMAAARPEMPSGIEDRNADVWEPLLALADAAGSDWPNRARDAAVALVGAAIDAEPSLGIRLLADLRTVFDQTKAAALPTSILLEGLIALPESPWGDLKGKPINDRGLARRLKQYGIGSRDIRIGEKSLKGYVKEDLHDTWLRYLPPRDAAEARQARQPLGNGGLSQENVADVADSERASPCDRDEETPMKSNGVADVADVGLPRGTEKGVVCEYHADREIDATNDGFPDVLRRAPPGAGCAQCHLGDGVLEAERDDGRLIWLHRECQRFWHSEHRRGQAA
jgi:hypothetical protein